MNAIAILLTTAALGVDYGWHRGPDGEWEYIIQIEPALVDTLSRGQALVSQMPPELRGVRRFRIQIGQGEVPRDQLPPGGILSVASSLDNPRALGTLASGGFGGPTSAPGLGGAAPGRWQSTSQPPDPGSYAYRNFDWIRAEPVRLDPLENSFLADLRNQGFEIGPSPSYAPSFPTILAGGRAGLGQPSGGFGPEPSTFDLQRQGAAFPSPPGIPGRFQLPQGPSDPAWNAPPANPGAFGAPGAFGVPGDFELPERPRLDVDQAHDGEAARRLRLNDDRLLAGRGQTASLPNPNATNNRMRAPSISLSSPNRARLPGDERLPGEGRAPADERAGQERRGGEREDEERTTASNSNRTSSERAHAEITRTAASRNTASQHATEKLWWPLTTTVLLLFGSLGGNVYLGWLAMDFYRRYRECAWELRTGN